MVCYCSALAAIFLGLIFYLVFAQRQGLNNTNIAYSDPVNFASLNPTGSSSARVPYYNGALRPT